MPDYCGRSQPPLHCFRNGWVELRANHNVHLKNTIATSNAATAQPSPNLIRMKPIGSSHDSGSRVNGAVTMSSLRIGAISFGNMHVLRCATPSRIVPKKRPSLTVGRSRIVLVNWMWRLTGELTLAVQFAFGKKVLPCSRRSSSKPWSRQGGHFHEGGLRVEVGVPLRGSADLLRRPPRRVRVRQQPRKFRNSRT